MKKQNETDAKVKKLKEDRLCLDWTLNHRRTVSGANGSVCSHWSVDVQGPELASAAVMNKGTTEFICSVFVLIELKPKRRKRQKLGKKNQNTP